MARLDEGLGDWDGEIYDGDGSTDAFAYMGNNPRTPRHPMGELPGPSFKESLICGGFVLAGTVLVAYSMLYDLFLN